MKNILRNSSSEWVQICKYDVCSTFITSTCVKPVFTDNYIITNHYSYASSLLLPGRSIQQENL